MSFIYNMFKALKVLPMRNPKWTIESAEKFKRKGSWTDFAAALNMDYETFRKMDTKYNIPGESHCRNLEDRLRRFLQANQPVNVALVPLRVEAVERTKYRSEWEDAVKKELDSFDKKAEADALAAKAALIAASPLDVVPSARSGVCVPKLSKSAAKLPSKSEIPADCPVSPVAAAHSGKSGTDLKSETAALLQRPSVSAPIVAFATLPERVKSKKSLVFNRQSYLTDIRKKAEEYRKQKEDEAKVKQELWMDLIIEKKHSRELESALQVIRKINKKAELDRAQARAELYKRREKFDCLCATVFRHQEEDEARQYEFVRIMVNNGFWEMLGDNVLSEEKLKTWCEKADLRYFPEIYQVLCRRYAFCNKVVLDHFTEHFLDVAQTVAAEEGDDFTPLVDPDAVAVHEALPAEPPQHDPEPLFNDKNVIEEKVISLQITNGSELFRSDQPTLFYSNIEMEEYRVITTQFPYDELGWMSAFVAPSVLDDRNLGHIISCVINGEEWRPPQPLEFKYCQKFISLWISGKRSSPLKKAVIAKLAMTYNLEVISVAGLVQEAVEAALQMQPDPNETKEKGGRRKSKDGSGTNTGKKGSISKLGRRKSRSLAASLSSLVSAGRNSPRDGFLQRLLRTLVEDGALDAMTVVDLIEQAIYMRIMHPKAKTPEQLLEAANAAETAKVGKDRGGGVKKDHPSGQEVKHHGRADSKTRMAHESRMLLEKKDELTPCFGWILTDLPMSVDVLQAIEQRLGVLSTEHEPPRNKWEESQLIPDSFGPKPRPKPRSFFGAILQIEFANEPELLSDFLAPGELPELSEEPPPEDVPPPVELQKATKSTGKGAKTSSPDDEEEIYQPVDVKRQLMKYLDTFDGPTDSAWNDVGKFYSNFVLEHRERYSDWRDPQAAFEAVMRTVESVMKLNRTVCSFQVSPEAQAQINLVLKDLCQYIWDYRTVIRLQLAQRMIGTKIGKSVVHYLFKQDVRLVRDVYCKMETQLREVASKSLDKVRKTVGLAIYRKSVFPLEERLTASLDLASIPKSPPNIQTMSAHLKFDCDDYTQPLQYNQPENFECLEDLQSEMLRLKHLQTPLDTTVVQGGYTDKVFLQNRLDNAVASFADKVSCWHRKNELVANVYELDPPPAEPSVFDFPYLGRDTHQEVFENWRAVEEGHAQNILRILPLLKIADCGLAANTKHVKEVFSGCIRTSNRTVETLMSDFATGYNRVHGLYPDIHLGLNWRKKLDALYLSMCNLVDYRHTGMQCCLRKLMGRSGFTEVVCSFRNACLELFQAEIDHFRGILLFLWRTYKTVVPQEEEADQQPVYPDMKMPLYLLEDQPLLEARKFIGDYDLEVPVTYDESMTCGDTREEQRIFLKILTDDDEFWFNCLQSMRVFLDKCGKAFLESLENRPAGVEAICSDVVPVPPKLDHEIPRSGLPSATSMRTFSISPPSTLFPSPSDTENSDNWLDIFEEHDFDDLLATVRDDIVKRQELKRTIAAEKAANHVVDPPKPPATDLEERFSPIIDVFHRERHGKDACWKKQEKFIRYILKKTANQEINHSMLKLCRIAVEGTRKANVVRAIAAETFCLLDSWLRNVHSAEQNYVDRFVDNALAALQPDEAVSRHDAKRWTPLVPPPAPVTE
ncbi:hypothetical protein BV898_01624 [Hypsibius exemplaris]|uniref:Uncharacterized protein n=1 Tax=Hypsibius exemplaris TaxID=2072580 RepID=A0A1W0XAX5_HYPEX|nr:hypothetical protein BV898_01624 [Hypsibius exemplaris]